MSPGTARALAAAGLALTAEAALHSRPPGGPARWERTNFRGRTVRLTAGPALALAATAGTALPPAACAVAGLGAAAAGLLDDHAGSADKGLRGHLGALRRGRLTTGGVKVLAIGASGIAAAGLLERRGPGPALLGGAVVAGSANLLNLLDLRPGRALKAGLAASLVLGQPGQAGAAAALLPGDLRERTMLGDTGANALGALLGLALVDRLPTTSHRAVALAVLTALTAASEVVSYSRVIEAVPPLRVLDRLGRLP